MSVQRGRPFHYQIIKTLPAGAAKPRLMIDYGFNIWRQKRASFTHGDIVVLTNKKALRQVRKINTVSVDELYTYQAYIEQVLDGNVLCVQIYLGFGNWTRQVVRLRGVSDKTSAQATTQLLKGIPFIILKTYKIEIIGQYTADVFYLPKSNHVQKIAEQGVYLNEQLERK